MVEPFTIRSHKLIILILNSTQIRHMYFTRIRMIILIQILPIRKVHFKVIKSQFNHKAVEYSVSSLREIRLQTPIIQNFQMFFDAFIFSRVDQIQ